jgi:hypothetical protein
MADLPGRPAVERILYRRMEELVEVLLLERFAHARSGGRRHVV